MNIKITYNWLLSYLETDADPYEMQKYLSLCGPSIETVEQVGDDYVFDIEVTSNRIDMASVFGVAQEAQAILPQFGKKAKLKFNPLEEYTFENMNAEPATRKKLDVEIKDFDLISRFTAMVFTDVQIEQASETIQKRLQMCGIKSINNIIDISNYLMLSIGQPTHMFDYDQIKDHKMVLRKSKKGEKLTTLDGKEIVLPGGDIVIEDGSGRIIDLCGIMGGENSSITTNTENVVFFVQTYDKKRIRKTSMLTGQRTLAATYFEKGLDPERVEQAFVYGVELINEMTGGLADSPLIDIYPHPRKEKRVKVYLKDIHRVIGITIEEAQVISILENLGFEVKRHENPELAYPDGVHFEVTVPSYRTDDVEIKEDLIEEVARVYGYHNLPSNISPLVYIKQPRNIENLFKIQSKTKYYLKHIGLHEFMNYSMISESLIHNLGMKTSDHLKIANTISKEIEYMRISLLPSLIKNMNDNLGRQDILKIFEIAKVYFPQKSELPDEQYKLAIATNTDFFDLKGIIEGLLEELNIDGLTYSHPEEERSDDEGSPQHLLSPISSAQIINSENTIIGYAGKLKETHKATLDIKEDIYIAEFDFQYIADHYSIIGSYKEPNQYAVIKLDATLEKKSQTFEETQTKSYNATKLLQKIELIDQYQDNITLRFYFSSPERNITEEEGKKELQKIQEKIS